jgi:VWFA-related protein
MNLAFRHRAFVARKCEWLLWVFLSPASLLIAQQLPPAGAIKKSVNLIQIPVLVRDHKGHSVANLRPTDFTVCDNDKAQPIARFRYVSPESTPGQGSVGTVSPTEASADIAPNGASGHGEPEQRFALIVIPQLQFASRFFALQALDKALREHLLDGTTVAIVDNSSLVLPFTDNRDSLAEALKQMQSVKMSPCVGGPWLPAAWDRLSQMRSMLGRKFLLMFTDLGLDRQCMGIGEFGIGNSPWRLLRSALSSGVAIYPVDPRGVVPVIPGGDASTPAYFGPDEAAPNAIGRINGMLSASLSELASQAESLAQVASLSGGRALTGNDLSRAFRMMEEDSTFYDIAYYLPDLQADGSYHRVRVEIKRPGLKAITKKGYYAPIPFAELSRSKKREWLYSALLEDQPLGEIELISRSSAFFNPPSADTTIHVALQARWWVPKSYASDRRWTMMVGIVQDEHGTVVAHFQHTNSWRVQNRGEPEESDYVLQEAAYNVLTRLKPGRYEIKIAVADLNVPLAGSSRLFSQVPEQISPNIVASSIVLSDQSVPGAENKQQTAEPSENPAGQINLMTSEDAIDPLEVDNRRLIPNVERVFSNDAQLTIFLRFYPKPKDDFSGGWKVTASLRDSTGKRVISDAPAEILKPTDNISGIPVLYTFDLSKLRMQEGEYMAELEFIPPAEKRVTRIGAHFIVATPHK